MAGWAPIFGSGLRDVSRTRGLRSKTGPPHGGVGPTTTASSSVRRIRTEEYLLSEGVFTTEAFIDNGPFGQRTVRFETGRLARQAAGSVVAYLDEETMVLSATTASKSPKDSLDFFPLTVDVEERMYAVGRIPGSFFRREGRPSEDAILTCRLIDRPLRPSFAKGLRNEIQVVGDHHGAEPGPPLRRRGDQRRLRLHAAGGPAVLRPDRRRAGRADQGPLGRLPDPHRAGARPCSTWSSPAGCSTTATSRS